MTNHILKQDSQTLLSILAKVNELKQFKEIILLYLEPALSEHCQIIKFEKNCLFVLVENGHWATQLRFQIPSLLPQLKSHDTLKNINGIICKTRPDTLSKYKSKKTTSRKVNPISPHTAQIILDNTKQIKHEKLKTIFEKIVRHGTTTITTIKPNSKIC